MSKQRHSNKRKPMLLGAILVAAAVAACSGEDGPPRPTADEGIATRQTAAALSTDAVGLAVEIDNGNPVPLKIIRGTRFYLNQIDMRAAIDSTKDEGVSGLAREGDFSELRWGGTHFVDQQFLLTPDANGKFTRQRFFRDAAWMKERSDFSIQQRSASGAPIGPRMTYEAGLDTHRDGEDDFFDRRLRAIQWTLDCPALQDCTGAKMFREEALVELRIAMHADRTFVLSPETASLELSWSSRGAHSYRIPVTHVTAPNWGYGFSIDLTATTPPRADGTYAPGSDIGYRITLRDGAGKRLHPEGSLPTYNEVIFGTNEPGIQYYRAFFDQTTTYYRRKHRERMLMSQIIGPAQDVQAIRSIADIELFLSPDDVQTTGTTTRDGVTAQFRTIPTAHDLFGGNWDVPVPDSWSYHLADDAKPGTYLVTVKGRRTYMGEDVPYSRTVEIQVGTKAHTQASLGTGPCNSCHSGPSALGKVLHANDNRAACASCHVPLGFELEGPIFVRTHFIHSRSKRVDAPITKCATCHLTEQSIQRTSKAACLSCHKSYPKSHVRDFGPITSMYVGGGRESFDSCTSNCHTNHPGSGLGSISENEE
ncbi:MAG: hypothetical protein JWO86_1721 [Myxococcaceae bacterium]|nr:hypothetical protein [Myxococcaceae bacterium]